MNRFIDLHIHTNLSDGSLSPMEIIDEAVKNGVDTIGIADHDTIDAYTEELYEYAKRKNIQIISAVEISTKMNKSGIHVLGYNFDINNDALKQSLFQIRNARHTYLYNVACKLKQLGYNVNVEWLDKIEAVTKAHIANDVIKNPENNDLLLNQFGHIPTMGEFIETTMNEGCPAYVKKETITPTEAVELIKRAGGKAILAHPVAYIHEDNLTEDEILELINDMGADGIEVNYIYIDHNHNKINEIDKWNEFASKHNLITTIGSDFHNKDGIHPRIGLINEINLDEKIIEQILRNLN